MRKEFKRWAPVIFFFAVMIVLAYIWYVTFPASAWEKTDNYFQMYVDFVATKPLDAFLYVSTGPGGEIVGWSFLPAYGLIAVHIVLHVIGRHERQQYTFVNKYYLLYLVVLALLTISIQNASQYHGWYLNPKFTDEAGMPAQGYVDTWTHILSPWLLGALIVPFALERYLGWNRKFMWFFMFAVLMIIALGWEIAETSDVYLNPDPTYFNYPMDSLKDIIMGAGIGTVLSCLVYERLVMGFNEKLWASE